MQQQINLDVAHVREYLNCFTESSVEKHSLLSKQIVAVSIHLWFMAKTSEAKEQLFSKRWTAVNWVQAGNTQRNSKYCSDGVHLVWGLVKDGFCRVPAKGKNIFFLWGSAILWTFSWDHLFIFWKCPSAPFLFHLQCWIYCTGLQMGFIVIWSWCHS